MTERFAKFVATLLALTKRTPVGTLLEVAAMALVSYGVGMIYLPAGVIMAGVCLAILGIASDA